MMSNYQNIPVIGFEAAPHNDSPVCTCRNTPYTDGFDTCLADGTVIEPTIDSAWDGLYICNRCLLVWRIPAFGATR
jgi:hypothetical protein